MLTILMSIVLNNAQISDFYHKHPDINIETMNLILIDFLEHTMKDSLQSNPFFGEVINTIKNLKHDISSSELHLLHQNLSKMEGGIFNNLKSYLDKHLSTNTKLCEILDKSITSIEVKDRFSKDYIGYRLCKLYPTAEINIQSNNYITFKQSNLDNIYISNHDSDENISLDKVTTFKSYIVDNNQHGIFLSHSSGIASKPNGFIEINDDKILIYLHNVDYSQEKIKMAIDIIDNLSSKLKEISHLEHDNGYSISKDTLEKINQEYQLFITQKDNLNRSIKDMTKQLTSQLDNISLPNLSLYLNTKFASISNKQFICETCQSAFQSKRSLASHMKIHKKKNITMVDTEGKGKETDVH